MKIAIVDDLSADRSLLRQQLEQELATRQMDAQIEEYDSGENFKKVFEPGKFAAVFLDIYMKEMNGIEVARLLYRADPKCRIVFLSCSSEHAVDSYAVEAAYYLLKPLSTEKLRHALDCCFPPLQAQDVLAVRTREGVVMLNRQEILYIEASNRRAQIHLEDSIIKSLDTYAEAILSLAEDSYFFPCARGLLVNLRMISALEGSDFVMANGHRLPISRRMKQEALRVFHAFAFRNIRGKRSP